MNCTWKQADGELFIDGKRIAKGYAGAPAASPSFVATAVAYFKEHEGVVPHMYLDVVGLVTIGIGFMIPSAVATAKLKLVHRSNGTRAVNSEKSVEWQVIKLLPKAKVASWYAPYTNLIMADAEIDAMLQVNINNFNRELRRRFPALELFPVPARLGLLDMAYSLGTRGLITKYPKFCAAADRQDWATCAAESKRRNVSPGRNKALADLFRSAV